MAASRYITVMFVPEGAGTGKEIRMQRWLLKSMAIALVALLVGILLFFSFYGSVLTRAAMTDKLKSENQKLLRYQYKVKLLEENLIQTREVVSRLVSLAGIDFEFPDFPTDSAIFAELDKQGMAVLNRSADDDLTFPSGMPIQGFMSQDFETEDEDHYHPGVDIACGEGSPVLATAAGEVVYSGEDETYGLMIVLKHNDSVTTLYGHNSELLVDIGKQVPAGGRIALSGNTGKSTAPHLHYEIRINEQPIDPLGK